MSEIKTHVLRLEGVNFDSTLYDTNDISVIRGASLVLETLGPVTRAVLAKLGIAQIQVIQSGAAQAAFRFQASDEEAQKAVQAVQQRLSTDIWPHMSVTLACANTLEIAEARARSSQLRQWTVPPLPNGRAERPDQLDRARGATIKTKHKGWVSDSVHARMEFGRTQRSWFFKERFDKTSLEDFDLCDSFEQIVGADQKGHSAERVPETVQSKLAVVHLDGDKFGNIARNVATKSGYATFNKAMTDILDAILHTCVDHACEAERQEFDRNAWRLRLETLVWGGDDITVVMPAWRLIDFFERFYGATKGKNIEGHPIHFTGGAIIAHHKTPIRQMVSLAEEAVQRNKEAGARNAYTIDVFESAALPEDDLKRHRQRVFGESETLAKMVAFPGDPATDLKASLSRWRREAGVAFPSLSKIHSVLTSAAPYGLFSPEAENAAHDGLEDYLKRVISAVTEENICLPDQWRLPSVGDMDRPASVDLALAATLWHYVQEAQS